MTSIRLKKSIFQALKLIVLSGIFVVLGIFIILQKERAFIGWLNLAFFGFAFVLGWFQIFDRRDQLVADDQTLFDRINLIEPIAWSSVEKISYKRTGFLFSYQEFAVVELKHFSGEAINLKIRKRLFRKKQEAGKPFEFLISLTHLEGKPKVIFGQLQDLKAMSELGA